MAAATLIVAFLLLFVGEVPAQTEKEIVEKATIKMKLKKYDEAAAVLARAREMYPANVEIARLTVELCEQTKAEAGQLIEAYSQLIKLLQMKEVTDGSLSAQDRRLLKKTQKDLAELTKVRKEVDAAVEEFVLSGIQACKKLARLGKEMEASFVFQRLIALEANAQEVQAKLRKLAMELKGKAALLRRPVGESGADPAKTEKLIRDARKSFKNGRYDEARLACKAALEVDPNLPEARAMLCDIADKTKDKAGMVTHGLGYLLFPLQEQSARRAEEIEKRLRKAAREMGPFFDATAKAADKVCKVAKKAIRQKRDSDVQYASEQLSRLTHRTKKVESVLLKLEAGSRGTRIFNGKSLSGWRSPGQAQAKVSGGCMVLEGYAGSVSLISYRKLRTRGSFAFRFTFRVEEAGLKSGPGARGAPAIFVTVWGDDKPRSATDTIFLPIQTDQTTRMVDMSRPSRTAAGWDQLGRSPYTGPVFEPGRWYELRAEYLADASVIVLRVNGKKAATLSVPRRVCPGRTGYVGLGQQLYKVVKVKDIYLVP